MSAAARHTAADTTMDAAIDAPPQDLLALVPDIPFANHLGLRIVELRDGRSRVELDAQRHHLNSHEVAHGGVLMTLIDVSMAMAVRSLDPDPQRNQTGSVTIEMKVSFMRPGTGRLRAEGRCVHRTATLLFCEGDVFDETGQIVARGSGTFKLIRKREARS